MNDHGKTTYYETYEVTVSSQREDEGSGHSGELMVKGRVDMRSLIEG
jgi:hypothetical protein